MLDSETTTLVVVEHDQNVIKPVTYELINAARKLAGKGKIIAVYFTDAEEADGSSLTHHGADEVRICIHSNYHQYTHETYEAGLLSVIEKVQPDIVLIPASNSGKEVSAAIATRLGVALATDCIDLQLSEEGPPWLPSHALLSLWIPPRIPPTWPCCCGRRIGWNSWACRRPD